MGEDRRKRTANRALLRELASILGSETWVQYVSVFPSNRPDSIVVSVLDAYYPARYVSDIYVEIQSYTNGEFHISYVEDHGGEQWMCRWDRHESDDYDRDHFHEPPLARHEDGVNRDFPIDLLSVIADVLAPWIHARLGELWTEYGG